jgi:hypothetical protein
MEIIHKNIPYGKSDTLTFDDRYHYCLHRQDWSGTEDVLFNENEIEEVLDLINLGEIVIHPNYSILFCSSEILVGEMEGILGCYVTKFEK